MLTYIQTFFNYIVANISYSWVVFLMTIESSFIPFPSEAVIPPACYAAYEGDLNIIVVFLCATLGSLLGALVNYYLAKYLGRPIVYRFANSKLGKMCLLSEDKVRDAEDYFVKKGASSTLIGRLLPGIRQLISIPAGLSNMPIGKFVFYTTLGSGIWNAILCVLGYYLASKIPSSELASTVHKYSVEIGLAIFSIVIVYIVIKYAYKYFFGKMKS